MRVCAMPACDTEFDPKPPGRGGPARIWCSRKCRIVGERMRANARMRAVYRRREAARRQDPLRAMDPNVARALVLTPWPWLRSRAEQKALDRYLEEHSWDVADAIVRQAAA